MSLPHVRLPPRGPLAGARPRLVAGRARRQRFNAARSGRPAGERALHLAGPLLGLGVGLVLELPVGGVASRCPPRGEGYVLCAIQKAWLPTVLLVLLAAGAGYVLARLVGELPAARRRWRQGERPRRDRLPGEPSPALRRDPLLLVATWGKTSDPHAAPPVHEWRRPGRPRSTQPGAQPDATSPEATTAPGPPLAPPGD